MPHTFTIDLGTTYRELSSFKEWGRTNNPGHNPVEFEVWGIADTTGATTLLPSADPGWKDESVSKGWTLLTDIERNDNGVAGIERSEEHTSELQSLMRISYAVFCLKKKKTEMKTTKH